MKEDVIQPEKEYFSGDSTKDDWIISWWLWKTAHLPNQHVSPRTIYFYLMGFLGFEKK